MGAGAKIIAGLKQAARGDMAVVYIEGQTWTRQPTDSVETKLVASRQKIADLYIERDQALALLQEWSEFGARIGSNPDPSKADLGSLARRTWDMLQATRDG